LFVIFAVLIGKTLFIFEVQAVDGEGQRRKIYLPIHPQKIDAPIPTIHLNRIRFATDIAFDASNGVCTIGGKQQM
jgi:hypothetical protein